MENKQIEVLISAEEIEARIKELAAEINESFKGEEITVICALKGAFIFMADLVRHLTMPLSIEFIELSSYKDGTESGDMQIVKDVGDYIEGKNILFLEDIIDTGNTLEIALNIIKS